MGDRESTGRLRRAASHFQRPLSEANIECCSLFNQSWVDRMDQELTIIGGRWYRDRERQLGEGHRPVAARTCDCARSEDGVWAQNGGP
jgi:hypothetical protein